MGVAKSVDTGKRSAKRARVLLAASISTAEGEKAVRLRDLSRSGALIECEDMLALGDEVIFTRGAIRVPARVAWVGGKRAGLEFAHMIDESEILVRISSGSGERGEKTYRRPRLTGENLTEQERMLARIWGLAPGSKG